MSVHVEDVQIEGRERREEEIFQIAEWQNTDMSYFPITSELISTTVLHNFAPGPV